MKAKPRATYVAASPQTWELIRAAYLSGLSAPTVAARFGVSVTALRKRAAREGWTKIAHARACAPPALPAHPHAHAHTHAPASARPGALAGARDDIAVRVEAVAARQMIPLFEEPTVMARTARELHRLEDDIPSAQHHPLIPANAGTQAGFQPSLMIEVVLRFSLGPGLRRDERV